MTSRIPGIVAAGALLASAWGCDGSVDTQRVVGQLESDRVEITAEFAEPITTIFVREGQPVSAGDPLLQQNTRRIDARLAETRALLEQNRARLDELTRGPRQEQIAAARASVEGARRELDFRSVEFDRATRIFERHLAARETVDQARAALDAARANLDSLEARLAELLEGTTVEELRQAESAVGQVAAQLESVEVDAERHRPRAPVDGVVDSRLFEVGERPAIGQPMLVMLAGNQPYVRVYVPESLRVSITPGTRARVFIDGRPEPIDGRVRWVASEAAFTPYFALTEHDRGRLSYAAKVDLTGIDGRLPDGVPVEVRFLTDDREP